MPRPVPLNLKPLRRSTPAGSSFKSFTQNLSLLHAAMLEKLEKTAK